MRGVGHNAIPISCGSGSPLVVRLGGDIAYVSDDPVSDALSSLVEEALELVFPGRTGFAAAIDVNHVGHEVSHGGYSR